MISNIPATDLETADPGRFDVQFEQIPDGHGLWWLFRAFWRVPPRGCFLHNMIAPDVYILALFKLMFFRRVHIAVMDLLLPLPAPGIVPRLKLLVRRLLLTQVDVFINYARDTRGFERVYGIPAEKFRYVPFKINNWQQVERQKITDEGYIFVGGQTRRDFDTLFEAVRDLPFPVRVVTPSDHVLVQNGSRLPASEFPPNVTLVRDAVTPETFVPQIAGARISVLPILPENISPSGIGVSLQCMALGKCTIISTGPSANDVLEDGETALIVPAGDASALREAILSVWQNDELREQIAAAGKAYARSLGNQDRLHRDCIELVCELWA